ncbi:hypothetical protein CsatB_002360 [Cannabis sativa]
MEEDKNLLFGTLVKEINNILLPNPLATSIDSLPPVQRSTVYISDVASEIGVRSVTPVFSTGNNGDITSVKIEGPEWNSFVADRGIRIGDVLLLRIVHNVPNIINVTVIRLNPQSNNYYRTLTPPLPQYQDENQDRDQNENRQFLCVKKLSEEDLSGDRLELPDEIELIDTDSFVVRVRDQTYEHIQILTRLKKSLRSENGDDDDQAVYLDDKWSKFVDERSIEEGDVIVFCVDFPRHVIIITVYRVDEEEDFQIPP